MVGERRGVARPSRRPSRICTGVVARRSRPRTTRSTSWRRSSTTTANAYVQFPSRSRTGRSPSAATSSAHGPTRRPSSAPSRRRGRLAATGPSSAASATAARTARPVPRDDRARRPTARRSSANSRSRRRGRRRSASSAPRTARRRRTGGPAPSAREPEPGQVLEQRRVELRRQRDPVVVLDAEQDPRPGLPCHPPHRSRSRRGPGGDSRSGPARSVSWPRSARRSWGYPTTHYSALICSFPSREGRSCRQTSCMVSRYTPEAVKQLLERIAKEISEGN